MLYNNYLDIRSKIDKACERVGRKSEDVTLLAVSKTKPSYMIEELYKHGVKAFGENKVQELVGKEEELPKDIEWHLIGHLQRNKVKYIVDKVALIHSVDSLRLAEAINVEAIKKDIVVNILVEVNVAKEDTKFGVTMEEVIPLITEISNSCSNIRIRGLMTIAPFVDDPEKNRWIFRDLHKLSVDIAGKNLNNVSVDILSMGMSNDFEVAVEEGATHVRVGTSIFGKRNYNIEG